MVKRKLCRRAAITLLGVLAACGGDETTTRSEPDASATERFPKAVAPTVPPSPTFAEHVAPIIYTHCTACHRQGGSAPFTLGSYDDVRDHATLVAELTGDGTMPPWLPEPGHGEFRGARVLSSIERQTIARWVEQGTPQGDTTKLPKPPTFDGGWTLGTPDLVLETGAPFVLPADGRDVYRNFVIAVPPGPLQFVRAVEIAPGDPRVVHHGVLRVDTTGGVRRLDERDAGTGFDGMEFGSARMPDGRFVGWTPGKRPDEGSEARAWRLIGGTDLVLQLHLRPTGKPEPVAAKVGLYFSKQPPTVPALSMELFSTEIDLPPGAADVHARDEYTVPVDVAVASVYPHAHYLGKSVEAWAMLPDGSRRWLIKIDDWDFDWQDQYRFVRPVRLPKGSTVHMDWRFDNSAANPHNPSSPPQHVRYGPASTDEMAELILEVEPVDPRTMAQLDESFRRKWLGGQAEHLQRQLERTPDDADTAANLGAFRQHLGQLEASVAAYERALSIDPTHEQANLELAIVRMSQGQLDVAVTLLRQAVAAAPTNARAHRLLGDAKRKQGKAAEAMGHYRRSIALDDGVAQVHNNLGILLEASGDLVGAREGFSRAAELSPRQPVFAKNLARVQAKLR